MSERPDQPAGHDAHEGLRAFDDGRAGDHHEGPLPGALLPGGVDHTTAAVGPGGLGVALLGIGGVLRRRRNRRRHESLDE